MHNIMLTPNLFTSANPKHTLLSDVILRRTTFCQPISSPSGPCNAPWFSSETLALYKSLTYSRHIPAGILTWLFPWDFPLSCTPLQPRSTVRWYLET